MIGQIITSKKKGIVSGIDMRALAFDEHMFPFCYLPKSLPCDAHLPKSLLFAASTSKICLCRLGSGNYAGAIYLQKYLMLMCTF
jgi:hypothetical protein